MGVRAADERRIGHAMQADVIDIAALAGDETLVFLANDPCANAFDSHGVISLSRCAPICPARLRLPVWLFCDGCVVADIEMTDIKAGWSERYSAACATFM